MNHILHKKPSSEASSEASSEDTDSDNDDEYNESSFASIDPAFKKILRNVKVQLYEHIIKGPPITSKKSQDNTLLFKYLKSLNGVYQICEELHTGRLSAVKIEGKLSTFPPHIYDSIKELLNWLSEFFSKNQYVDTIPYSDYIDVQLRRYPFLQK